MKRYVSFERVESWQAEVATVTTAAPGGDVMGRSVSLDLERARSVATVAAEAAGALLRSKAQRAFTVQSKGENGDLVTELDLASEALIVSHIRAAFPEHRILTEEMGELAGSALWTWLVDPLDGTNNL